jgi:hypothetical protein
VSSELDWSDDGVKPGLGARALFVAVAGRWLKEDVGAGSRVSNVCGRREGDICTICTKRHRTVSADISTGTTQDYTFTMPLVPTAAATTSPQKRSLHQLTAQPPSASRFVPRRFSCSFSRWCCALSSFCSSVADGPAIGICTAVVCVCVCVGVGERVCASEGGLAEGAAGRSETSSSSESVQDWVGVLDASEEGPEAWSTAS